MEVIEKKSIPTMIGTNLDVWFHRDDWGKYPFVVTIWDAGCNMLDQRRYLHEGDARVYFNKLNEWR